VIGEYTGASAGTQPRIRILIVEDKPVMCAGLTDLLGEYSEFEVVGALSDTGSLPAALRRTRPDVVLTDLRLADGTGVDVCLAVRSLTPTAQVVVFTAYLDTEAILAVIAAGALGYVLKARAEVCLIQALCLAAKGEPWLDPEAAGKLLPFLKRAIACAAGNDSFPVDPTETAALSAFGTGRFVLPFTEYVGHPSRTH